MTGCRGCRIADGVIDALAHSELELREDNERLRRRVAALEQEREDVLIDREVFRAWATEWMPDVVTTMIRLQRDTHNLQVRIQYLVDERDRARRDLQSVGAELRAVRERAA
jgi:hypothetical protein